MGLSGNILVKSNITKSKFDNVFDIRKEYCRTGNTGKRTYNEYIGWDHVF